MAALWVAHLAGLSRRRRLTGGFAVLAAAAVVTFAVTTFVPDVHVSRLSAIIALGLSAGFLITSDLLEETGRALVAVTVLIAVAGLTVTYRRPSDSDFVVPAGDASQVLFSGYYPLAVTDHGSLVRPEDRHQGGALALAGSRVIAMTGLGALYSLNRDGDGASVTGTRLPLASPSNFAEFDAGAPPNVARHYFRSQDLLVRPAAGGWQLFVSHHRWSATASCVSVVVSTAELNAGLDAVVADWRPVVELQPCLPLDAAIREGIEPFDGLESGGRMSWLSDHELLLTAGDHAFDGLNRKVAAAQADSYDYGKTHVLDVQTGTLRRFTLGHRNPQGLYIDQEGRIWSTEHGPRGGDELNLLREGGNYGWPYATDGTDYRGFSWPPADQRRPGTEGFVAPVYTWVPSIGVSNLIRIEADRFPRWKGDLLVGSIRGRTLFRLTMEQDHVRQVEPLAIGTAVRDLIEGPGGDIWVWNDEGHLVTIAPAPAEAAGGERFMPCANCHVTGVAPDLRNVVNRAVASEPSYGAYTPGLRAAGGVWTPSRLDAFLRDPNAFAPGTTMTYTVPDPQERRAIINFLLEH